MIVYISLIADIFHAGHSRLINEGKKLGDVTIGLLSESACAELGDVPLLSYEKKERSS